MSIVRFVRFIVLYYYVQPAHDQHVVIVHLPSPSVAKSLDLQG